MVWNTAIIAATAFLLASSPALAQSEDCTRHFDPGHYKTSRQHAAKAFPGLEHVLR